MNTFGIHIPGKALYTLLDMKINGYLTWTETKPHPIGEVIGVLMFTTGELAEEYIHKVMPARAEFVSVCRVSKELSSVFIAQMIASKIDYALIDVPPIAVDEHAEGLKGFEQDYVRDYAIVDIKKAGARFIN